MAGPLDLFVRLGVLGVTLSVFARDILGPLLGEIGRSHLAQDPRPASLANLGALIELFQQFLVERHLYCLHPYQSTTFFIGATHEEAGARQFLKPTPPTVSTRYPDPAMTTDTFDPALLEGEAFHLNPYPVLKRLRHDHPVWQHPRDGTWFVTRYEDVVAGFLDHDSLSSTIFEQSHSAVFGPSLTAMDGDEHSQKRAIIAPEFVGRKLDAFMPVIERNVRDLIVGFTEKAARDLIEGFIKGRETDLVDTFSTRLPVNVIVDMLALPQSDHDRFHYWYPTFLAGLSPDPVLRKKGIEANTEFHDYLDPYVQERLRNPGDDLISKLCMAEVEGEKLTVHDIKSFVSLLLTAGGETTDRAIANLWWLLLNHPEQFEAVRQDHSLIDQAFTETMRCEAPVGGEVRLVLQDWEMRGVTIPAGAVVSLSIHGANHDERVFSNPETFDILREDLYIGREMRVGYHEAGRSSHIGFGLGKHFCVGYQLARTEAVVGTRMILEAIDDVRIKPGRNPVMGGNAGMRSVTSLDIEFDPA